jgi:hypothetical protein
VLLLPLLLLFEDQFRSVKAQDSVGFVKWTPLSSLSPSVIEVDSQHYWVAQMDVGWKGWLKVWRLKKDLTIGEKLLDIGGKKGEGFFVRDIEWVGKWLLISIIEGYDTFLEWDKKDVEKPWQTKLLIFDPQTHQMKDLGINKDLLNTKLFAHPSGEKVLIVDTRGQGIFGTKQIKIFSLQPTLNAKPEIIKNLDFPYKVVGRFFLPVQWLPDGQHFWAIGTDERGAQKLLIVGLDGSVKKLTPDDHWLLGGDVYGVLPLVIEPWLCRMSSVTSQDRQRYIALMSSRRKKHTCLGYYSTEKLEKEQVIVGWDIPYPEVLKPLGQRILVVVAVTPDGCLILQEGWFASFGEKKRVWVWNIDKGTITPLIEVGWIEQIYGWLGEEWMIVEVRGETFEVEIEHDIGGKIKMKKGTYEYGLLHIPPKFVKQ